MKREKLEVIYSVGVVIAIPLLVILNTVMLVRSTRNAFNVELTRKADVVNGVIAESARADIVAKRYDVLQRSFTALEKAQPAIKATSVIVEQDGQLTQAVRTATAPEKMSANSALQARIAFERKRPIAKLMDVEYDGRKAQAWNVVTPVLSDTGTVIAAVSTNTVTTDAMEAINKAYSTSFMILIGSVVVIVGMLFRHFRLVTYVRLLAKQREVNQTMSDFLSVATHELKAPTTVIKGYISNVLDGTAGPITDDARQQLMVAFSQTDRLNELVQDLLNVSRIEQGRVSYTMRAVDSRALLGMIVGNYQPIAAAKGVTLSIETLDPMPAVYCDEGRLQEIYTNLIDNAIKYTAKGMVTIGQRVEKDRVITNVRDTGFGMSPDAKRRLFQRFYRIKTDQTQNISGTGLGLWIIKQYIEAMGGTIEVESIEGVGSNFIVALPIAPQQ